MMGILFTKRGSSSRITDQDRAILQLKQTRDRLRQYQKRIDLNILTDKELAIKLLKSDQKKRALSLLRKKKFQEQLLFKTESQLENLEKMVHDLEFAEVEMKVIDGLRVGNNALRMLQELLSIDDVEEVLGNTRESVEKQQEIDKLLSGVLSDEDEAGVEAELEILVNDGVRWQTPDQLPRALPDVPTTAPGILMEKSGYSNSPQSLLT